ncbi:MAG: hypothetical protein M0R05_00135 [Bacilli bacterium]|nr:hypothetical protein [Bacilli bacterium]MDD4076607.1 hypothetical protein [Bacilli bacterium]MDD4387927.1 hypothetical protein [Bacilli bacterium]
MKKTILFWLLLGLFIFTGCSSKGKLEGVKGIKKQDIFSQKEDKYYVYFHRLDCADCDEAAPAIINYMKIINEYSGCKNKRPIYSVLLFSEEEKPRQSVYIFREYEGTDGEGTNGTFKVTGITEWQDLYIGSTSSLISITVNEGVKKAYFEAQGAESIIAKLEEQLGDCHLK